MEEEHHPLQSRSKREREKGDDETVEAKPRPWRTRFTRGQILGVAEVFDSGKGEGEPLGELNVSDDGEGGGDPVEDGHESVRTEEEEDGDGGDSCGGDLGGGEVGGFRDGDGDEGGGEVEVETMVRERTMGT
ncbi:sulfate transmembrane transporter [Actinidia rufa]|uniref:Sulfate transmembrane transporter n=1 Tax=Actinidia rufa TaxID=165716 RepID=A0A7J0E1F9_9ERIC|nr:sulfate transmembrane transporter [Actinidia rufa]GFS46725.1 sulfate transmembrane transporter [Actinidia rufa]